jgi:DNA-binding transcriptional ArsR family regulator
MSCMPDGATSGEVARWLSLRHNVVSGQLRVLVRAGLVTVRQERGAVHFHARPEAMRVLFDLAADR